MQPYFEATASCATTRHGKTIYPALAPQVQPDVVSYTATATSCNRSREWAKAGSSFPTSWILGFRPLSFNMEQCPTFVRHGQPRNPGTRKKAWTLINVMHRRRSLHVKPTRCSFYVSKSSRVGVDLACWKSTKTTQRPIIVPQSPPQRTGCPPFRDLQRFTGDVFTFRKRLTSPV